MTGEISAALPESGDHRRGSAGPEAGAVELRPLWWAVFALVALFCVLQVAELGDISSLRGDETYYIQAAHTMNEEGGWLVPRYESGELRFRKPIGAHWIVAASTQLLGLGVAQSRLSSVLLTLAGLPFVYGLAVMLFDSRRAALLAVLLQISSRMVYSLAHQARPDAPLAFFVTAATFFFARLLFVGDRDRRDGILAYAATAGVVLTKGAIFAVFEVLPLAAFLALFGRRLAHGRMRAVLSPWGLATFLLLTVPWFGYVLARHGNEFVTTFLGDQILERVGGGGVLSFPSNLLQFSLLFSFDTLPWSAAILGMACVAPRVLRGAMRTRPLGWWFLLTWLAAALLVFSAGNIVRGRYLLPVASAVPLLGGAVLSRAWRDESMRRVLGWLLAAQTAVAVLIAAAFVGQVSGLVAPGVGVGMGAAVTLLVVLGPGAFRVGRSRPSALVAGVGALMLGIMVCGNTLLRPTAPLATLFTLAREHGSSGAVGILTAGFDKPERLGAVVLLATGRRAEAILAGGTVEESVRGIREFLAARGDRLMIVDDGLYAHLPGDVLSQVRHVASRTGVKNPGLAPAVVDRVPAWLAEAARGRTVTLHALLRDAAPEH